MPFPIVNSWNEWDPLEEVIVGIADGAQFHPVPDPLSGHAKAPIYAAAGSGFPATVLQCARDQIEQFAAALAAEGVIVRRPDSLPLSGEIRTPLWSVSSGYNLMNARDLVLVLGDELIEVPSASRARYFEVLAYRSLFKEYFSQGARWTAAPRPALSDELFCNPYVRRALGVTARATTEYEPVFDAADFARCGRDIFYQHGDRTNRLGIAWLQRHVGSRFRFHEVETRCTTPVHIDTTFVPLGPGRVLVNPDWIGRLPDICRDWEIIEAPAPEGSTRYPAGFVSETSRWIAMNVFLIDERRIFVEAQQRTLIGLLKDRGFTPIPLDFTYPPLLGGAFHCCTLDIRRRTPPPASIGA
jgi:glycine amidinotransferase